MVDTFLTSLSVSWGSKGRQRTTTLTVVSAMVDCCCVARRAGCARLARESCFSTARNSYRLTTDTIDELRPTSLIGVRHKSKASLGREVRLLTAAMRARGGTNFHTMDSSQWAYIASLLRAARKPVPRRIALLERMNADIGRRRRLLLFLRHSRSPTVRWPQRRNWACAEAWWAVGGEEERARKKERGGARAGVAARVSAVSEPLCSAWNERQHKVRRFPTRATSRAVHRLHATYTTHIHIA